MSGPIVPGDAEKLAAVVSTLPLEGRFRSVLLSLDSPGGDFAPAVELTRMIAREGYGTHIPAGAQCLSGCALAFMAGRQYGEDLFFPWRSISTNAVLGFHAPFVFSAKADGIAPEIARTLLPDAERAAALAAADMVQLSLDEILPVSLVRELLTYEAQSFLYIETIDQLGRWKIDIAGAETMKAPLGFEPTALQEAAKRFCENYRFWRYDVGLQARETDQRFGQFGALRTGTRCETELAKQGYRFTFLNYETGERDQGSVLHWQTLEASRKFAGLTPEEISGPYNYRAPFDPRDEPPSQIDGACLQGFQWIGGFSGFAWSESIAHATFRSCAGEGITVTPFRIECRHGESTVQIVVDRRFLPAGVSDEAMKIAVDGRTFPAALGKMQNLNGISAYVAKYGRGQPLFDAMRTGQLVTFQIAGLDLTLHLRDADKTIGNMEASCL